MKLHTSIMLGLISSLFVVNVATAAESGGMMKQQEYESDCAGMGMMHGDMKVDHVARVQKHLGELKSKLNLTKDQEPAWSDFSDQVIAQAKSMTSMRESMKKDMPQTAPERMEMMADRMKDRAQRMATMADSVKTFYKALTPEQRLVFDKMQISHMGRMGHMQHMKP